MASNVAAKATQLMRAALCTRYGGPEVFEVRMVPRPKVHDGDVLVRVYTSSVTAGDWRISSSEVPGGYWPIMRLAMGFTAPRQKILGVEFAGVVEAVGKDVTTFAPGDRVLAQPDWTMGGHGEFATVPASGAIARLPASLSFRDAISLPFGFVSAAHFLRAAHLQQGDRVLIIGASGCVGVHAVQLARHVGAHVTAVCSGANAELVRSLGADDVIDYAAGERYTELGGRARYDVVMDVVGTCSHAEARHVTQPGGTFLALVCGVADQVRALWAREPRMVAGVAVGTAALLEECVALAEEGVLRPVIDSEFPLDAIRDAVARVATHRKRGTVVVRVREEE